MTRAEQLIQWARTELGSPYIFGAAGQACTPAYREQVMRNKPEYAEAIRKNCPVLSGRQPSCSGCTYKGRKAYDCRGLTREGIRAVTGRPVIGTGATSQWKDETNWTVKGPISELPDTPCLVFVQKGDVMSHTGIYIGGSVIHASGHNTGVIDSTMPRSWTHYAIPIGLYEEGEIKMPDTYLMRHRDKGPQVKALQEGLMKLGYDLGAYGADGDFGSKTEAAVRQFQQDSGLPIDAVWDSDCQAQMKARIAALAQAHSEPEGLPEKIDALIDILTNHRAAIDRALEEILDARKVIA